MAELGTVRGELPGSSGSERDEQCLKQHHNGPGTPPVIPDQHSPHQGGAEPGQGPGREVLDEETPAKPTPLGVDVKTTGNSEVDIILQRLAEADELPTPRHVSVYEEAHGALYGILTALDAPSRATQAGPPSQARHRS